LLDTAGPAPLLGEAFGAAIEKWANQPPEWGQGWGAFGQRYGSNLAYNAVRQTISYGAAAALHEDTRYFASHRHGFWSRTKYALASTVIARRPDGRQTFAIADVSGVVGAGIISSTWGPESGKGPGNIAGNIGISFGITAGLNIVREFLPDLHHKSSDGRP